MDSGVITEAQLMEALELQKQSKERIGTVLIENNFITEEDLIDALQMQLGVDYIDLTKSSIPIEMARFVPKNVAKKHNVVPVKVAGDMLYIAMSDPLDFVAQEEIKRITGKKVIPMISTARATEYEINRLYGSEGAVRAMEEMKREARGADAPTTVQTMQNVEDGVSAAPTIRFVNSIIERAVVERASDIHLEPQDGEMVVRMRIDGRLRKLLTVPSELQSTVITRLKVMGNMNIAERKIPQDGNCMVNVRKHVIDLRISSMPTMYGEKIVIRLLDKTAQNVSKASIGLSDRDMKLYESLVKNNSGVILVVGPTGSGKTTTLFTMLTELASEQVNVITLEDPVEYTIPGVNQCQINEKQGMTFASGLKAILRQDPDIISVGEIRDGETGEIAIRAAITGHLVLSTLHTNDAIATVNRLEDIGVERYLIANALRGVISQRLVRKICPKCREAYHPDEEECLQLGIKPDDNVTFWRGKGCPDCYHTGYQGRQGVFEIFMINHRIRNLIAAGESADVIEEAAIEDGFVTMKENCRNLVLEGVTSAQEAIRAINSTVG